MRFLVCSAFFFFKQKTAYDVRISDWSSDVCSSDLCFRRITSCATAGPGGCWCVNWALCTATTSAPTACTRMSGQIGRASCRERVCKYVYISVGGGTLQKKIDKNNGDTISKIHSQK